MYVFNRVFLRSYIPVMFLMFKNTDSSTLPNHVYWLHLKGSNLPPDKIITTHTVNSGIIPREIYDSARRNLIVGFNNRDTIIVETVR